MQLHIFTCDWLSSLQKGLQTAHVVAEMSQQGSPVFDLWANEHKTIIIHSGGTQAEIKRIYDFLAQGVMPTAVFQEDEECLNNAHTACGIIITESIYETAKKVREGGWESISDFKVWENTWEKDLVDLLNSHPLAI